MKKVLLTLVFVALIAAVGSAQSPSSNKAFFTVNYDKIKVAGPNYDPTDIGWTSPVTIFNIQDALKTSNVGGVSATLSMEAALWTYNLTEATVNGGKATSSSRAAIKAWVEIDGTKMWPEKVVYADRLQATGLQADLACDVDSVTDPSDVHTCTVSGTIALELFQRTKNANAFTFFLGPLTPMLHDVKVKAQGFIECRQNGEPIQCAKTTLDNYKAQTKAVIGKATLLLEEHNNWNAIK